MVGSLMQLVAYGASDIYLSNYISLHPYNYVQTKTKLLSHKNFKKVKRYLTEDDQNIECPISYQKISYGSKYFQCVGCKYNFSYKSVKHIGFKNNCSICKKKSWNNNTVYYNKL